jgi:hypothetical protein
MSFASGITDFASAASDYFTAESDRSKADASREQAAAAETGAAADLLKGQGDTIEAGMYGTASDLATLNADYTAQSTAIQTAQADRQMFMVAGSQRAAAGASGSSGGGSASDIMANAASQGALNRQVLQQQGVITEAGYTEQATAYTDQQSAALVASEAETKAAEGETDTANAYNDTAHAYEQAATGADVSAGIKTIAGFVDIFTPSTPAA